MSILALVHDDVVLAMVQVAERLCDRDDLLHKGSKAAGADNPVGVHEHIFQFIPRR